MLRILVPALAAALPLAAEPMAWPKEFRIRPVKVEPVTNPENGSHVVLTPHFKIISETIISGPDFARFATVVESVPQVLEAFPLPLWAPPSKEQVNIILCKDEAGFRDLGGHRGAVGWYDGRQRHILIMADYFLKPPSLQPTRLQPRPNQDLLVHELVHLSMHGVLWRTPPWFSEGVAEYFAVCHKGDGWYTFHDIESSLRDHLRKSLTVEKDGSLSLLPVETILALDSVTWLEATQDGFNGNPYLPYATALLLAHYHFNGGQARRSRTEEHLKLLHTLTPRDKTPPFPVEDAAKEIEARLIKFWGPKGLNLVFNRK